MMVSTAALVDDVLSGGSGTDGLAGGGGNDSSTAASTMICWMAAMATTR